MTKTAQQQRARPAVSYVRVSRVGGRSGDSFISPEIQRDAIEALAERLGFTVIEIIEELDASGGDDKREGWNRALGLVEAGTAKAILVYNLSRFSRKQVHAIEAIDRIRAAGGELHSVQEGSFSNDAAGTLLRDTLLRFAQFERDRATENFAVAQTRAIERGIYTASRVPFGYWRNPVTRKLEVVEAEAAVVKKLFEMRADGESWTSLARHLIASGGSPKTDRQAVKWIIQNKTYLGHSFNGDLIHKNAHASIVSQRLFDAANAVKGKKPDHTGRLSSQTLLNGLVICDGCGHRMGIGSFSGEAGYSCRTVNCTSRASVKASELDPEVLDRLKAMWKTYTFAPEARVVVGDGQTEADLAEARRALEDARYLLEKFESNKREYLRAMTPAEFAAELSALKASEREAQIALEMAEAVHVEPTRRENVADLWETWTDETRREYLARVLSAVFVKSANKRRVPVGGRIAVGMADGLWLHPRSHWSAEPFEEPLSPLKLVTRAKARRSKKEG